MENKPLLLRAVVVIKLCGNTEQSCTWDKIEGFVLASRGTAPADDDIVL
jgi:hypothetical protein